MKIICGMNRQDAFAQRLPLGEERQEKKERGFYALMRGLLYIDFLTAKLVKKVEKLCGMSLKNLK